MANLVAGNKILDCRVVIFDKDGTLVDYRMVDFELAKARRKSVCKIVGTEAAELWEKAVGVDLKTDRIDCHGPLSSEPRRDEILITAAVFYLKGHTWPEARQLAQAAYEEADRSMKSPYGSVLIEGVAETLRKLKDAGLKLAIASTDTHKRTEESFKTLGIASLFDTVVGPEDVANGKPAPDMVCEILKRTGCKADESVMVGDSPVDMQMGRNAHVQACIGVLTGITRPEGFRKLADVVVDSVAQFRVR